MKKLYLIIYFFLSINTYSAAPPINDDPCGAIMLTVGSSCSFATYNTSGATQTSGPPAPTCGVSLGNDVWFTVVVPPSGHINIDTYKGAILKGELALYSGSCGALTLIDCSMDGSPCSGMSLISHSGLTPGSTVYIRFWRRNKLSTGSDGTFGICVLEVQCPGSTNNTCSAATLINQGGGPLTGSNGPWTSDSPDTPGNLKAVFCGSGSTVENNIWFKFTATATSHAFNITASGCSSGGVYGIQAQVFSITPDAQGCCGSFTTKSNCISGTTSGVVNATGLTVGQTYYLMIDGYEGDNCNYSIAGWSNVVLSIELVSFNASYNNNNTVLFNWITATERNNDYFTIQQSIDAYNWTDIAKIKGSGTTALQKSYSYVLNNEIQLPTIYFRLKQNDFNGNYSYSSIFALTKESKLENYISLSPNPSSDNSSKIDVFVSKEGEYTLSLTSSSGVSMAKKMFLSKGVNSFNLTVFGEIEKGFYFISLTNQYGSQVNTSKLIFN
ncbi:MAG: hypothetical protein JSU07_10535 [Bacteroidetes bacterium]|nr:hypothetical protein [Bacteroidota bacterium]